jgi:hypothetical protein
VFRRFSVGANGETITQEYKFYFEDQSLAMQVPLVQKNLRPLSTCMSFSTEPRII